MKAARRIAVFTGKCPLLGPLAWILCAQFFVAHLAVATRWHIRYNWANNLISGLGNAAYGA